MEASNQPYFIPAPFASSNLANATVPIPTPAQTNGFASWDQGWGEVNATDETAGGIPPRWQDFLGLFYICSAWLQWQQAGGAFLAYNSTFQTTIGGYPNGAIVASAVTSGLYWRSIVDNNTTNPDTGGAGWVRFLSGIQLAHGECYLEYVSTTQIKLVPRNGCNIVIDGAQYQIPAAGIAFSSSGLSANTLYYIYLSVNAGVLVLGGAGTGHSTDTTAGNVGVEILAGNSAFTLVGMALTDGSGLFQSGPTLVKSWFNRRPTGVSGTPLSGAMTTSIKPTFAHLGGDVVVLVWDDEGVSAVTQGTCENSNSANSTLTLLGVDGSALGKGTTTSGANQEAAGATLYFGAGELTEGAHTFALYGCVTGGTGTFTDLTANLQITQ